MRLEIITRSVEETEGAGELLAKSLLPGDVVAFTGGLGAGKTAFTRGLARGLRIDARVTSPTFTIVNEYPGAGGKMPLFHFDMYRLASSEELFELGWEDYLRRRGVCAVEWSENVADALPPETVRVSIEKLSDNERRITVVRPEGASV